eukprot:scaffold7039_cov255-Pinguiococcus_pyrenoidosus.AAC.2
MLQNEGNPVVSWRALPACFFTYLCKLRRWQDRRLAFLQHVRQLGPCDLFAVLPHLLHALRRLQEGNVGADLPEGLAARDGLVEAEALACIRPREDEDVVVSLARQFVSRIAGRLHAAQCQLRGHHALALGVATPLGRHLVLDHDAGHASCRVALHGALDVKLVAVAGVSVADAGQFVWSQSVADLPRAGVHLSVGH